MGGALVDISEIGKDGEAALALQRIQNFDAHQLVREKELGAKFALRELVPPIQRVQDLFRLITPGQIGFFPERQQDTIRDQANAFFNFLEQCKGFEIEGAQPSPTEARNALVAKADTLYQKYFDVLFPLISFATARSQDFARLESDARAATQAAKDQASSVLEELEVQRSSADAILDQVRAAAAEQGVSKQAIHFKNEADLHKNLAKDWLKYTMGSAGILVFYSVASLFVDQLPGIDASTPYRAAQIAVSKVLIFAVLAYLLALSARNFLSHRHNEIVNRHRQNALATFTALAEATSDAASSDIVLSHAASCIFSPQETGLTKQEGSHSDSVPTFQIVPRIGNLGGGAAS